MVKKVNHPQIKTADLSDETIKALLDILVIRYYAERDRTDEIGKRQAAATLAESRKIQRFLDR